MQFYYHPDHLGSSSYITNLDGEVAQHIEYVPFGEVFVEERNNIWNTPYLFNAKEFDEETGLYYYGARYYEPRLSLWKSVDKLSEESLNVSSYCYTDNNPIIYIDPDGNKKHNWIKEHNKNNKYDARFNNASNQKRFTNKLVQIWSHGIREDMRHRAWGIEVSVDYYAPKPNGRGYYHSSRRDETNISDAKSFLSYLKVLCINKQNMEITKQITICKKHSNIMIYTESKNDIGLWIAHPPCYMASVSDVSKIENIISAALQHSNSGIPVNAETAKSVLKDMRIKNWNSLYKSYKIISYSVAEKKIIITPFVYTNKGVFPDSKAKKLLI